MGVVETDERWRSEAACRGMETEAFFPRGHSDIARYDEAQAKAVCGSCVVRMQCLAYALDSDQPYGIWGGLNRDERRMLQGAER